MVTYETTVAVPNTEGLLRPDMTASVSAILGSREAKALIPSEAVHQDGDTNLVYVLHPERKEGRVEKRVVEDGDG